ncbi:DUF58 domain-containing protein [Nocardioides lijunqiniae]|uniref:DUF58 domain-containing protein n=1 Tax=Nocardioides lijunqiniae TaxID=2760832 RepID=UPI0018781E4D|nr:DUF58 domain-containing protein [Nocardioides lijunqiniae]
MLRLWRTTTTRGRATTALAILLLVAGLKWQYPLVAGLGGCLLLLVAVEVVSVLSSTGLDVRREVAPRVVVRHGACEGMLRVLGRRRRGLVRIDAADLVDGSLVPISLPDRIGEDEARSAASVSYPIATPRRGLITVGPVQLRRYGLTGMAARSTEAGGLDEVRVLPRQVPVTSLPRGHRRAASGGDDSVEHGGTDLVGLHEYSMGDDLRRLHWATSARSGTLMVREDAEPSEPHVCVLLDDRRIAYSDIDESAEQFEEAVELAAGLCRVAIEAGNPVRFRTTSGLHEVVVPGSATRQPRRQAQELDYLLAEIGVAPVYPPAPLGARDLDVVVAVTGAAADLRELALALGAAPSRVVMVVDPKPLVSASQEVGLLVLRGASSESLASGWDEAMAR